MACCPNCAIVAMGSLEGDETLIWWPGAIQSQKGEVDGIYQNLGRDFRAAKDEGILSTNNWAETQRLMQEWITYRNSIGLTDLLWGSTVTRLNHYKTLAIEWRSVLKNLGGLVTGPDPKLEVDSPSSIVTAVKYISVAAIVVGISYVGGKALGIIPKR